MLGVSLNTDSICQISFEKSEHCMFEGESDFWVKFGTIERGGGGGFTMRVMRLSAVFLLEGDNLALFVYSCDDET